MTRIKQNIIILHEKSFEPFDISLYAGNMFMNRFCIDEEAGFELSGVSFLKESYKKWRDHTKLNEKYDESSGVMADIHDIKNYPTQTAYTECSYKTMNMMNYREINDEIISCYSRFVSFDYYENQNNVLHGTEPSHVTQSKMDQGDKSQEEVICVNAQQGRKEKGNYFQIA